MHTLNLDDPNHANQSIFQCLPLVHYLKYDPISNRLVGITGKTTVNNGFEMYAFVVEEDGSCTLSVNLQGLFEPSAFTYDPVSATFYIADVGFLYIFETKTSKITTVDIENILFDIEASY
eukprot:Phypoly_transcript_09145.p1 GENE.Phypoly_transcript_09145~~Phypoly_transcript_09145.p1  ORF type:complete len:120 (+),score=14.99 Phypoly_transcript_09145:760-1119(+)